MHVLGVQRFYCLHPHMPIPRNPRLPQGVVAQKLLAVKLMGHPCSKPSGMQPFTPANKVINIT